VRLRTTIAGTIGLLVAIALIFGVNWRRLGVSDEHPLGEPTQLREHLGKHWREIPLRQNRRQVPELGRELPFARYVDDDMDSPGLGERIEVVFDETGKVRVVEVTLQGKAHHFDQEPLTGSRIFALTLWTEAGGVMGTPVFRGGGYVDDFENDRVVGEWWYLNTDEQVVRLFAK
jgi:hypothetical protein